MDVAEMRLRRAIQEVARRAPEYAPELKRWSIQIVSSRLRPVVYGDPPVLAAGEGWITREEPTVIERRVAELGFRAQHALLDAPRDLKSPGDEALWSLGVSLVAHTILDARFPTPPRDRELFSQITDLIGPSLDNHDPSGIFEALKHHEAEIDQVLDET